MRMVLVSTINDSELDLLLSNKESDIRTQAINTKVLKLQVRITGIMDGMDLFGRI